MSTVWVTQEMPAFNYLPAEEYGEIKFLSPYQFSPGAISIKNRDLVRSLRKQLESYDEENDWVLPSGSPIMAMAVSMIVARKTKKLRALRWDKFQYCYVPITVEM